jgi:hemerythrin HHE cation binding domain-containing protein
MNAIQFLKKQHEEAKAGFQKIEQANEGQRGQLWKHLSPELKLHEQMEQEYLYGPASKESKEPVLASWPERHAREVKEAEQLMATIDGRSPQDSEWLASVKRLHRALDDHIKEEEREMWPKIQQAMKPAELDEAGRKMAAMKAQSAKK